MLKHHVRLECRSSPGVCTRRKAGKVLLSIMLLLPGRCTQCSTMLESVVSHSVFLLCHEYEEKLMIIAQPARRQ